MYFPVLVHYNTSDLAYLGRQLIGTSVLLGRIFEVPIQMYLSDAIVLRFNWDNSRFIGTVTCVNIAIILNGKHVLNGK